jgi:gliding motility-associated-like protein
VINLNTTLDITAVLSNYNGFNISCNNVNNGFIHVTVEGHIGNLNYTLLPGNLTDANPQTTNILEFDNLSAGDYTLTIADSNCDNGITFNYTLTQPAPLTAQAILVSDPVLCNGDTETYQISASGGVAPYAGTGNYTFASGVNNVTITDANGCSTTVSVLVDEPQPLEANAAVISPISCANSTATVAVQATGGTAPYTGTGIFDVSPGTFNYTVTDANGCNVIGSIEITAPLPLDFEILSVNNPGCDSNWDFNDGSICIAVSGGNNPMPVGGNWVSLGGGFWCLDNLTAGDYTVSVTDSNGCAAPRIETVTLTAPPALVANVNTQVITNCDTGTAQQVNQLIIAGGVPPYQINWSGGNACEVPDDLCMLTSLNGTYFVSIQDQFSIQNNCAPLVLQVNVNLPQPGRGTFSYSAQGNTACSLIAVNTPIAFTQELSGDVIRTEWDFGDGAPPAINIANPVYAYNTPGSYNVTLTITDALGCTNTFTNTVEVGKGYELILPTAFTPNGDGLNDTIRPVALCMQQISMQIFDSWGALLYQEMAEGDVLIGWNGLIKGKNRAENGNYLMVVSALTETGERLKRQITVTLID